MTTYLSFVVATSPLNNLLHWLFTGLTLPNLVADLPNLTSARKRHKTVKQGIKYQSCNENVSTSTVILQPRPFIVCPIDSVKKFGTYGKPIRSWFQTRLQLGSGIIDRRQPCVTAKAASANFVVQFTLTCKKPSGNLTSTSFPTQGASRPLSLSSSTTLREETLNHHDTDQTIHDDSTSKISDKVDVSVRAKVNAQLGRKPKSNVPDGGMEFGYQKVLRTMVTEPREPLRHPDPSTSTGRKVQDATDVQLPSWKRALRLIGMRKFSQVDKKALPVFNLKDDGVAMALEILMAEFGRGTHSSFMDDTYSIYLQEDERAAICFKVIKKVAVMYGDPLCAANQGDHVFEAFRGFCHRKRWRLAVVGAGPTLAAYARTQCWRTMEFAVEQVLNPMTNTVLDETSGKTITRTNRRLLTNGIKLYLYEPRHGIQPRLEQALMEVYKAWREDRRKRDSPRAYSATINPFAMPTVTRYMYTTGQGGKPNSVAGLIRLGANDGYLLEPCIQLAGAPKGVTGFLVTHAMGLLRDEGVTYMTFGLEALPELGEITLMPSLIENTSRHIYRTTFETLGLLGRKKFHESFHPEKDRQVPLYLLFPPGLPSVSVYEAVLDAAHISPHEVWRRWQAARSARRKQHAVAASKPSVTTNGSGQKERKGPYERSR